jgi:CRISPR system Cascade subunit CasD
MNGFLLHLKGPMMSFGDKGFGQIREAGGYPSRSVVLGIIAAAIGIGRNDERLLELHRSLRVHVAAIMPGDPGIDYHIVQPMEYEEESLYLHRRRREDVSSVITWREYLYDAHFMAVVEGDDSDLVEQCRQALRSPVYTAYLGRRSCPPSLPLQPHAIGNGTIDEEFQTAYSRWLAEQHDERGKLPRGLGKRLPDYLDIWLEGVIPTGMATRYVAQEERRDLLIALPRSYVARLVVHKRANLAKTESSASDINEEFYEDVL